MADDNRHYTTYVNAPVDHVWDVLTSGPAQADWYMPAVAWGLDVGAKVVWGSAAQVFVSGEVTAVRADVGFLSHTFRFPFLDEPPGLVRWRVTQMGQVTQVWLRHELVTRPATDGIVGGSWPVMLARLKTLVETGSPMPEPVWPATEGWDTDPD
ncbi:MAG TPA: SRPBCC domain-containing protein [Acidimicrobiales bacterium]